MFRVIQWNVKINSDPELIIECLKNNSGNKYTIINLQEVSEKLMDCIKENFKDSYFAYSLEYRKPGHFEGKNRKMGVATIIIGGKINKADILNETVFPERTLYSEIEINKKIVKNLTFHSLTGCDYKKAKSSNFASIASFLY